MASRPKSAKTSRKKPVKGPRVRRPQAPAFERRKSRLNQFRHRLRLETANSISHGIGAGLSLAGAALLVSWSIKTQDTWRIASACIYGICMVLVFLSSTLYHSTMRPRTKRLFHLLDHSAIFLAIAGTYTPIALILLRGSVGWWLLVYIWVLAAAGIFFKTKYINRFTVLSTLIYVLMGWSILLVIRSFSAAMPLGGLIVFFAGGLTYTLGTIFYAWRSFTYHHMVWHICVILGALLHFISVYRYIF